MRTNRIIIYLIGFLSSISIALTSYINSSFLENFINTYYISAIYILSSFLTIIALIKIPRILTKIGNRFTAIVLSIILFFSLILLSSASTSYVAILAFMLYFISSTLLFTSLDIFFEDFSKNTAIGRFRGFYLTITNLAWVFAQIFSGSIIAKSSLSGSYFIASIFMMATTLIFIFFLKDFKDPQYKKIPILKTIRFFIKNKHVSKIYLLNLILKFFYTWMIIYTPIYLNSYLNFTWSQIGIIFTIMLLPFVLLTFPAGELSDKIGEKKMLKFGFLIMSLFTLIIPLINNSSLWLWALILFGTRVGAAIVEIMTESYFFKLEKEEDTDAISFFRNTTPLAYVIAPLIAIPILLLIPSFQYIFFVLGTILLYGFYITINLKDVR